MSQLWTAPAILSSSALVSSKSDNYVASRSVSFNARRRFIALTWLFTNLPRDARVDIPSKIRHPTPRDGDWRALALVFCRSPAWHAKHATDFLKWRHWRHPSHLAKARYRADLPKRQGSRVRMSGCDYKGFRRIPG